MMEVRRIRNWGRLNSIVIAVAISFIAAQICRADALQDAQQLFDQGKYPEALRTIAPALSKLKPDDDSGQRYQFLMLRAECLLRQNQRISAGGSFDLAVKCAPDLKTAAIARANSLLLKQSPNNRYTPKAGGEPIDILDPQSRAHAFDALRTDMAKTVQPKYQQAMDGTSLQPMLNVLPSLLDIGYLEFAATGSAAETRNDIQAMGQRARDLINSELRRMQHQINALEVAANSNDNYTRRGLFSDERTMVQEDIDYARKIGQTARDARRRAKELGFDGQAWEPVIADSDDLAERAQALLDVAN
jgi:hypothetical protein